MTISAIILAAGQSKRMGRQKLLLPWEDTTILGQIIKVVRAAGLGDILVVAARGIDQLTNIALQQEARIVLTQDLAQSEMLHSLQLGLSQRAGSEAALICLGDQPQIEERCVRMICQAYEHAPGSMVVPSHQMRRGHPWLLPRTFWAEVLGMRAPASMRNFLHEHDQEIYYLPYDRPSILQDMDTPEDYARYKPAA